MATTRYIVNNVSGQTINGEYILPKYKVYTALLTQSGGDNPDSTYSGDLVIGRTYQIYNLGSAAGYDFTNVGAPNNDLNTWFVATGTTPNSWGFDVCLNYNSGAPVVTVLENTIGNIWFNYRNTGGYNMNSNSLFILNKLFTLITSRFSDDGGVSTYDAFIIKNDESLLTINVFNNIGAPGDSLISSNMPLCIEIRVYS